MKSGILMASLSRGSKYAGYRVASPNEFGTLDCDICKFSVRKLLPITFWASRIFRWLLYFIKKFVTSALNKL
jgi:hypothetical protein